MTYSLNGKFNGIRLRKKDIKKINQLLNKYEENFTETNANLKTRLEEFTNLQEEEKSFYKELQNKYSSLYKENQKKLIDFIQKGDSLQNNMAVSFTEETKELKQGLIQVKKEVLENHEKDTVTQREKAEEFFGEIKANQKTVDGHLKKTQKELERLHHLFAEAENEQKVKYEHDLAEKEKKLVSFVKEKESEFKKSLQQLDQHLKETQDKLSQESTDNFNRLNTQFKTVMEKVESFITQTGVFEKVDLLRDKLAKDLNDYTEKIMRLQEDYKTFESIDQKMEDMKKVESEVKKILSSIDTEKNLLRKTEIKLESLQELASTLDNRMMHIDENRKDIDQFYKNLKQYSKETESLKSDVEYFLNHKEDLEKSMQMLSELEKYSSELKQSYASLDNRVDASSEQQMHLDKKLEEIEEKSILIEANHKKILEFAKKYDALEIAVTDVEQRQKAMNKIRQELAVEKNKLAGLKKEIQEQINIALSLKDNNNHGQNFDNDLSLNHSEIIRMVKTLHDMGWPKEQIAQHLKKELYEIDVYLKGGE